MKCFLLTFSKTFPCKLNISIKLEEQPKLPNKHQALPGLAGNTIPVWNSLEVLKVHEGSINPSLQSDTFYWTDRNPPAVLLSVYLYLSSAAEDKAVYATGP